MQSVKTNAWYFIKFYDLLGRSFNETKASPRLYLLLVTMIYGAVRAAHSVIQKWHNLDHRSSSIEEFTVIVMAILFLTELLFYPSRIKIPLNFIEGAFFRYYELSNDLIEIKNRGHKRAMIYNYGLLFGFTSYCLSYSIVPWFDVIKLISIAPENETINFEEITMPFSSMSFFKMTNLKYFTIECLWQSFFLMIVMFIVGHWCGVFTSSLTHLTTEVNVISVLVNRIEKILDTTSKSNDMLYLLPTKSEDKLQEWLVNTVEHHNAIIKAVRDQNKAYSASLFLFNQLACIHLAMVIYCGLALQETATRWRYLYALLVTMTNFVIICWPGQALINECTELYRSICDISWYNKPEWFKHKFRIIMVFTQEPLVLNPGGLYVLNLHSLLNIVRVAYSYSNVMLSMKLEKV